jgi:histidine kinase
MSLGPRRFRVRLFLSYLLVIGVGAVTLLVTGSLLASTLFDSHLHRMDRGGMGVMDWMGPAVVAQLEQAFADSVRIALLVAVGAAVLAAGAVAALVGHRLVRPLEAIRAATHRLAAGDYEQLAPVPPEAELAALAEDVNALAGALATTERKRLQLIDEVAHELRTPLTTIEGYMEGLIDGILPPTEETFAAVADEAARLKRLAEDLAQLSRAEEGTISLNLRDVDLAEVAGRAAERLRPQFDDRGVRLEVAAAGPLRVRVDPDRLAQVLPNLLGNALVHSDKGGMVSVSSGHDGVWAWVAVSATGQGIAPEELERIFERFHRVSSGSAQGSGRGIGLTIARGIARGHRGDVRASSSGLGRGATFRVTIPLASERRASVLSESRPI